jgi:hypothetical protein
VAGGDGVENSTLEKMVVVLRSKQRRQVVKVDMPKINGIL